MKCTNTGCVAKINDTTLLYSGGEPSSLETYTYDVVRDVWTRMSDMSNYRLYHGCGTVDAQARLTILDTKLMHCFSQICGNPI